MKKRIGITYTKTKFEHYWKWITPGELKDDLELVELSFEKNNTEDIATCDGFILTGGIDIDPSYYNGSPDYENIPESFSPERDQFEEKVYRYAQLHLIPILAICRGIQLVNVLQGGSLIQDLGSTGNQRHYLQANTDNQHHLKVSADSLLFNIAGKESGQVNSAHHQSVDPNAIGHNLKVNALADDGKTIEGLEFENKTTTGFMLCVQWHPERMKDKETNPFSKKIKEQFLLEVRRNGINKLIIHNPATAEIICTLNEDNKFSLQKKFELLKQSEPAWHQLSVAVRVMIIKKFSDLLEKNIEHLASRLTVEMGKPLNQSRNEIRGARTRIKWLTDNAEKYLSDEIMTTGDGLEEKISYEPLGTICNISAWNYPYLVGVNVFVPALLAGNGVMYKPSEYASLSGLEIEKLLKQAGVHANIFHTAIGGGDVGGQLLQLPFDGFYFTGSYKTGKHVYEQVSSKMVPCQCELGGKDPLYVADDIHDIKSVAAATADGAFYNNGQSCCAVERIYVHEKVYDRYIDEFLKEVKSWKIGSPIEEGNYVGPLTREQQLSTLEEQVNDAVKKGASVLTGGKRVDGKGYFFEPTVLTNVNHQMLVMTEESFGPLIGIMRVKDDEDAIHFMQDTVYGLTAAVYSANRNRAENILKRINAGTGYWNCCDRVSAALPWSGRNHSGFGVTLSHAGLRAFTRPKAYHLKG